MATLVVGGLVAGGVLGGTTAAAIATTVAVTAAAAVVDQVIFNKSPDLPDYSDQQAQLLDKTTIREQAKEGVLQLGEKEDKVKRARGKDQFKVALALAEKEDKESDAPELGATVTSEEQGVQLG